MKRFRGLIFTGTGILAIVTTVSLMMDMGNEVIVGNLIAGASLIAFAAACQQPITTPVPPITPLRSATLEIDKITGTEFPPTNVNFDGQNHSLTTIFHDAGIDLNIVEDEMDIPDTFGTQFTEAELLSLMRAHQSVSPPSNNWSAYLAIVPEFRQSGVLGIMFDSPTRGGCAVFHNVRFIRNDEWAFLRTTAHELGHQFNLHHEDGTTIQAGTVTKRTIMNQTRLISPWPDAISYEFSDNSKTHLTDHPEDNVRPGGSRFYDCNQEHSNWHARIT